MAEAPAKAYNPLFVYGESGLGKTHLLHAIGHYAQRLFPGIKVRYVSSEEFTNDFINSLRDDKMQAFQGRYRSQDLLLIDDIQFLERAERTQEEFFHTFNTLHNANKQIVISSDRPPRQLSTLEDRLRTRFEWGLITDVQVPDLETRIAILRKKAAQDGMNPPPEVLEFIATKIQSNIRELEGALIRVTAFASLNKQDVDMLLAEIVLKDLISGIRDPGDHRGAHHGRRRRVLLGVARRSHRHLPQSGAGQRPADRHVPVPGVDRPFTAQDRTNVRRTRPHHSHARGSKDPGPDGRAYERLQPDQRAHQPDQVASPRVVSTIRITAKVEALAGLESVVDTRRPAVATRHAQFVGAAVENLCGAVDAGARSPVVHCEPVVRRTEARRSSTVVPRVFTGQADVVPSVHT